MLGLAALAFGQAVGFPFVHWDDPFYVLENPLVAAPFGHGLTALLATHQQGYPIPVTILSYALDHALFGFHPAAFHATNVALHGIGIALLYALGLRLGLGRKTAGLAAGLYGLHPLLAEPVCWVTGRKDLLAIALLLGSLVVLLGRLASPSDEPGAESDPAPPGRARWIAALVLAGLAMLAKPSAVVAPALLWLVARFTPGPRALSRRRLALTLSPLVLLAAVIVLAGVTGLRRIGDLPPRTWGSASLDVLGAWALNARNLLLPQDLLVSYYRVNGDPGILAMLLAWAGLAGLGLLLWRKTAPRSLSRLGFLFAALAYLPVSNALHLRRFVADSYLALPLAGVALGVGGLVRDHWPKRLSHAGRLLAPAALVVLAGLSALQARTWARDTNLWRPVLARYPMRPEPYGLLARATLAAGKTDRAARLFARQATRFPRWPHDLADQAWAYEILGQPEQAEGLLERGVRLGQQQAVERYLYGLLRSPRLPAPDRRDLVARAFRLGLPHLKKATRNPAVFLRAAKILRSLGLPHRAADAETWAHSLAPPHAR